VIDLAAVSHTGRELDLMLAGRKPLAMFYAELSELPEEGLIPELAFAPYVESNRFLREASVVDGGYSEILKRPTKVKYVYFASPEEAWRIRATILLKAAFSEANCHWSEALERIECHLLGYSKEETDAWCAHSPVLKSLRDRLDARA